jgi:hypothetical protein
MITPAARVSFFSFKKGGCPPRLQGSASQEAGVAKMHKTWAYSIAGENVVNIR